MRNRATRSAAALALAFAAVSIGAGPAGAVDGVLPDTVVAEVSESAPQETTVVEQIGAAVASLIDPHDDAVAAADVPSQPPGVAGRQDGEDRGAEEVDTYANGSGAYDQGYADGRRDATDGEENPDPGVAPPPVPDCLPGDNPYAEDPLAAAEYAAAFTAACGEVVLATYEGAYDDQYEAGYQDGLAEGPDCGVNPDAEGCPPVDPCEADPDAEGCEDDETPPPGNPGGKPPGNGGGGSGSGTQLGTTTPVAQAGAGTFRSLVDRTRREARPQAAASRVDRAPAGAQLARTGSETADAAFFGAAFLAGGVLLVIAGRPRRAAAHRACAGAGPAHAHEPGRLGLPSVGGSAAM